MIMVCSQCGAPLDVAEGSQFARCQYCGVNVQLRPPTAPPQVVRVQAKAPQANPGSRVGLVVGIMAALTVFGASMAFRLLSAAPAPGNLAVPNLPSAVLAAVTPPSGPQHAAGPVCLLDANGDGVADPLCMTGPLGSPRQPTVVDGASGAVLWTGEPSENSPQLGCLDNRWFVLVEPNFQAQFFDARNLGAPVRVLLRDKLSELGMGKGCARLRTDDGSVQGVELPGGTAVDCEAKLRRYYLEPPGVIGLTGERTELKVGKRSYELKKRRSGTSMLTVNVKENGKSLWSRELPYAAPTFDSAIAVAGGSLVLWAAEPGKTDRGILVGLDEATGEQRYAIPSQLSVSNSLRYYGFNGRYVLVQAWTSLQAFEPENGKLAWKIGP
jgi:DNA-directed RNA polymerase subunit RPC12/RpoP